MQTDGSGEGLLGHLSFLLEVILASTHLSRLLQLCLFPEPAVEPSGPQEGHREAGPGRHTGHQEEGSRAPEPHMGLYTRAELLTVGGQPGRLKHEDLTQGCGP